MNWFRENRFLGAFLIVVGVCMLGAFWFLFSAKSDWDDAMTRFNQTAAELNRLERLAPYPSGENLRKMKTHADDYASRARQIEGRTQDARAFRSRRWRRTNFNRICGWR